MPQTDRQTDKATWWNFTAFGDNIAIAQDNTKWPAFVKKVYGGIEECPDTKRQHFQGCVQCNGQQRFSAMRSWMNCHWEPANSVEASKKYAMKSDTAAGEKSIVENSLKYYSADEICIELAKIIYDDWRELWDYKTDNKHYMFEEAVRRMLRKDRKLAGQLMNPSLRKWFEFTKDVWYDYAKKELESAAPAAVQEAEP